MVLTYTIKESWTAATLLFGLDIAKASEQVVGWRQNYEDGWLIASVTPRGRSGFCGGWNPHKHEGILVLNDEGGLWTTTWYAKGWEGDWKR